MINRKLQLNATSAMATPALTHSSTTNALCHHTRRCSLLASNVSANTGFYKISCFTNNRQPSSSGEPVPTGLSILFHWTSQRKLSLTDH
ncbi:hypothetical protein T4B_4284 [Trichinella pseudospiralis]|uniref:Uncharacterized protein n=1 Tax=Trichinella pseudospiralis TaxID=6337 RepID=A0A0V1KEI9_TRIPS|nr:hypothetical protein T4A_14288 [Trichinella pseudospiralis]KRZ20704.1 hypothetical protein T4B_4284 [Trichinella pseudospiralis]KRZ45601.1 hypothetical protein T4C_2279 [Trichinella pseudospiralis]